VVVPQFGMRGPHISVCLVVCGTDRRWEDDLSNSGADHSGVVVASEPHTVNASRGN
jgi:hypothetical protein